MLFWVSTLKKKIINCEIRKDVCFKYHTQYLPTKQSAEMYNARYR